MRALDQQELKHVSGGFNGAVLSVGIIATGVGAMLYGQNQIESTFDAMLNLEPRDEISLAEALLMPIIAIPYAMIEAFKVIPFTVAGLGLSIGLASVT